MQQHSIKFVYSAVNALASGKFDPETEERVSQAIKAELLALAAQLPAQAIMDIAA